MKKIFERYVILKYIISSYIKTLLVSFLLFTIIFAVLEFTGVYSKLETILDLKYNSPFVLVPLYGFIGLSFLCFFIGFLMYFYKYKRSKVRSQFYKTVSSVLKQN